MNVLVTGARGYIGRAVAHRLADAGHAVVGFDLAPLVEEGPLHTASSIRQLVGDVRDEEGLTQTLQDHAVDAVVHLAGKIVVSESVTEPLAYWDHNVGGGIALLKAMVAADVRQMVFSSSAAVYGEVAPEPIAEQHRREPMNPYGRTKLTMEWMLEDLDRAGAVHYVALRYFNAAGAVPGVTVERHHPETHLIPNALTAAASGRPLKIFGSDYDTGDGTAMRDYVHVGDLADAHRVALDHLAQGGASLALNVATGLGYTVAEVVASLERALGRPVPTVAADRRPGDPPLLIGRGTAIREHLGWVPAHPDLDDITKSAVAAHRP